MYDFQYVSQQTYSHCRPIYIQSNGFYGAIHINKQIYEV
jgi:hypothetical protein